MTFELPPAPEGSDEEWRRCIDPLRAAPDFRHMVKRAEERQREALDAFRDAGGPQFLGFRTSEAYCRRSPTRMPCRLEEGDGLTVYDRDERLNLRPSEGSVLIEMWIETTFTAEMVERPQMDSLRSTTL